MSQWFFKGLFTVNRTYICHILLFGIFSFLLCGCSVPEVPTDATALESHVWPAPPQSPKIQWVKEVRGPEDHGIAKGFWARVSESISGVQSQPINKPYGVVADGEGRLVVVDTGSAVVHILDSKSNRYHLLGPENGFRFEAPIDVAEDDHGNLYITDSGAGVIYRYSFKDQAFSRFSPFKLKRPTGIAFSAKQQLLFVSDTTAHQVVVFDLAGQELRRLGKRGARDVQFNYPTDLFVDRKGQLYVTDALNQRIQILTPEGQLIAKFGESGDITGYLPKPKGVAVDSHGHIYVCDALLDAVQIFDSSGQLLLFFGGTGSRAGEFWMPTGIDIDSNDYIYVSDSFNRRVQVFRYLGDQQQSSQAPAPGGY